MGCALNIQCYSVYLSSQFVFYRFIESYLESSHWSR